MTQTRFDSAKSLLKTQIAQSASEEDPSHAENTLSWLLRLNPDADDVLQLAAFGHDVERSLPDRYTRDMFSSYDEYKLAHAKRSGKTAAVFAKQAGYSSRETDRLAYIIEKGEFESDDPEVQLLCDADSISFFDNNAVYYLQQKGREWAAKKMNFMYERASSRSRKHIRTVLANKPELDLLGLVND